MERWDETLLPIPGMLELVSQLKAQATACTCFPTLHCAFINIKTVFR